jgi:hypothetical protein
MAVAPGTARNLLGSFLGTVEEFEKVLQLPRVLILHISLLPPCVVQAPAEHGLVPVKLALLPRDEVPPGLENGGLV